MFACLSRQYIAANYKDKNTYVRSFDLFSFFNLLVFYLSALSNSQSRTNRWIIIMSIFHLISSCHAVSVELVKCKILKVWFSKEVINVTSTNTKNPITSLFICYFKSYLNIFFIFGLITVKNANDEGFLNSSFLTYSHISAFSHIWSLNFVR